MKQLVEDRQVLVGGTSTEASFGISAQDQAGIVAILRDRIYTNKPLAVLREYGANAWDAHREKDIPRKPFTVQLATRFDPELVIRDYGPGLAEDDVFTVYTQYGRSTKRNTNNAIGMLGIGCKSAFAYTSAFTVISYFGGKKTTYAAYLDETKIGKITKMAEADTKETGVEIRIPIQEADFGRFQTEAAKLYAFFDPQPKINVQLADVRSIGTKIGNAQFFKNFHEVAHLIPSRWTAVMGGVPYRLTAENLETILRKESEKGEYPDLLEFVSGSGGIIHFDIGDVDVSASREEIEYTKPTIKNLVDRFVVLRKDIEGHILKIVENKAATTWAKRLEVQKALASFSLKLLKGETDLTSPYVALPTDLAKNAPKTFLFSRIAEIATKTPRGKPTTAYGCRPTSGTISVNPKTTLVIRDVAKVGHRNFGYDTDPIIIDPVKDDLTFDRAELDALLVQMRIDGIRIRMLSEFPIYLVHEKPVVERLPHYSKTHFKWTGETWARPPSKLWEPLNADTLPSGAVYVMLDRFEIKYQNFTHDWPRDAAFLKEVFGFATPDVYGVKVSAEPGKDTMDLRSWICAKIREGLRAFPEAYQVLGAFRWYHNDPRFTLTSDLPADHIICKYAAAGSKWLEYDKKLKTEQRDAIRQLNYKLEHWDELKDIYEGQRRGARKMRQQLYDRYPVFDPTRGGVGLAVLNDPFIPPVKKPDPVLQSDGTFLQPPDPPPPEPTEAQKRQALYLDYIKLVDSKKEASPCLVPEIPLSSSPTIPSPSTSPVDP